MLKADTDRLIEEHTRRHQKELREMREQLAIEKESWEEMYMRKQEALLKSKVSLSAHLLLRLSPKVTDNNSLGYSHSAGFLWWG